jgi:precorrin-2/cobalt-factor-2 C20-methyltransferase
VPKRLENEAKKAARIYAVGVGPGDPELLTRKAERIIRSVPVICTPTGTADASSYALSIVEQFIDRKRQEVLVQVFPMQKDQGGLDEFWDKAAAEVAERVRQGLDVAFITIGDPFLYSTFLYLYRIFQEKYPHIPIEIVPGISSINAAAVAAGLPLGMAAERIAILPATYEDDELRRTLKEFDTVVLMKVNRVFDRVYALLAELGLERQAVFVRRVGSSEQEVVFDLATLVGQKLDYLSMLIVKKNGKETLHTIEGKGTKTAVEAMADIYRTLPEEAAADWLKNSR